MSFALFFAMTRNNQALENQLECDFGWYGECSYAVAGVLAWLVSHLAVGATIWQARPINLYRYIEHRLD